MKKLSIPNGMSLTAQVNKVWVSFYNGSLIPVEAVDSISKKIISLDLNAELHEVGEAILDSSNTLKSGSEEPLVVKKKSPRKSSKKT